MKIKVYAILGISFLFLSFIPNTQSETSIWSSTGTATQDISLNKTEDNNELSYNISYTFKNIRYGSIIDTGSFVLNTKSELKQLIIDLKDAVEKVGVEHKIVWERPKYTISVGGLSPMKKGNFKIEIGEMYCPIHKKAVSYTHLTLPTKA